MTSRDSGFSDVRFSCTTKKKKKASFCTCCFGQAYRETESWLPVAGFSVPGRVMAPCAV